MAPVALKASLMAAMSPASAVEASICLHAGGRAGAFGEPVAHVGGLGGHAGSGGLYGGHVRLAGLEIVTDRLESLADGFEVGLAGVDDFGDGHAIVENSGGFGRLRRSRGIAGAAGAEQSEAGEGSKGEAGLANRHEALRSWSGASRRQSV